MLQQIKELLLDVQVQLSGITLILGVLVIISGSISFAMFLTEEGFQCLTFACFAYTNSGDIDGLEQHLILVKQVDRSGSFFIKWFGWLSPIFYAPYLDYVKANKAYIRAMERVIERERSGEAKKGGWNKR